MIPKGIFGSNSDSDPGEVKQNGRNLQTMLFAAWLDTLPKCEYHVAVKRLALAPAHFI